MRIGLDLRMLGGGSGIDRYITELSHEILKQDRQNEYVLFFRDEKQAAGYKDYGHKLVVTGIAHYSMAEQLKFPRILNRENLDLVHFPHFNAPIFYHRPFVVTIHDLTHTLIPGKKKSHFLHRLAYQAVINNAIKNSQMIIAVSQSTKKQIMDYYGIFANKIQVVYEGFKDIYRMIDKDAAFAQVSNKFEIKKPFILYAGVWRRYKNLPMLARSFDMLREKGLDFELVLAGEPDKFYPEIEKEVFSIKYKNDIKAVGRVSDEDLAMLYNAAALFVLPSQMEGFGLTTLEAAACGTAIACSDIPTLREVIGQGAEYFDPENAGNMADVLESILVNPKKQEDLANLALSRSKHFSWKKAGEETIRVYQEVLS